MASAPFTEVVAEAVVVVVNAMRTAVGVTAIRGGCGCGGGGRLHRRSQWVIQGLWWPLSRTKHVWYSEHGTYY